MIEYLLDTNILIYTMNNRPLGVREEFEKHQEQLAVSSVSLMELYYGAERSSDLQQNLKVIQGLAARLIVIDYDGDAARHTGEIRATLALDGKPIGPYDVMLAGQARAKGLVLVTNNEKEFDRVDGLRLTNWVQGAK